jgi:hypothetical protein
MHHYGYSRNVVLDHFRRSRMTANNVIMPDGTKSDAHDIICEGCEKSISEHSCGGSVTITTGGAGTGRSTGPRKAPATRPECPHCHGAVHFSMPGGLQNVECAMRQYYQDTGVIADPYARLPIYGLDEIRAMLEWTTTLSTPFTYGRMESAAGGAGTYAALRPKADPKEKSERPKKRKAAEKGERIEDMVSEVLDEIPAEDGDGDLGSIGTVKASKTGKSKRKNKAPLAAVAEAYEGPTEEIPVGTVIPNDKLFDDEQPALDLEAERARKRAERRAILAGR